MKLFYTKRSPYARKVRVIALEKNIPLELIEEDLTKKSKQLIDANPLGKIPALVLDNGKILCDSPVICEYLDSMKDKPLFISKTGEERFNVLTFAAIADGLMDVTVALYMEKVRHPQDYNQLFVKNQEDTIRQTLKSLEERVAEFKDLNLATVAAASAIGYMNFRLPHLCPSAQYPKLTKWFEEFSKRPSMAATLPG